MDGDYIWHILAIERSAQPVPAVLTVGDDKPSEAQLVLKPGRADTSAVVEIFGMGRDAERNIANHTRPGRQPGWIIREMRMEMPRVLELMDQTASLAKPP